MQKSLASNGHSINANNLYHDSHLSKPRAMNNRSFSPGGDPYQRHGQMSNGDQRASHPSEDSKEGKRGPDEIVADDTELVSMRARYMGIPPRKAKKRRLNDRKFQFDWSTDGDTTNLNLDTGKSINVGFGRGHFGGFEIQGNKRGGMDRHWSEKELIEMTERDWRIFREDFSIATKGSFAI